VCGDGSYSLFKTLCVAVFVCTSYLFKIIFNILLPSTFAPPERSLRTGFQTNILYAFSHLSHTCCNAPFISPCKHEKDRAHKRLRRYDIDVKSEYDRTISFHIISHKSLSSLSFVEDTRSIADSDPPLPCPRLASSTDSILTAACLLCYKHSHGHCCPMKPAP
jgi:hypothetical protein